MPFASISYTERTTVTATNILGGAYKGALRLPRRLFGSRNERVVKKLWLTASTTAPFEERIRSLCPDGDGDDYDDAFAARVAALEKPTDDDAEAQAEYEQRRQAIRVELSVPLRELADDMRRRLAEGASQEELMSEAFALVREASRRAQAHRHFDCQIIGGRVLYDGSVAEMRTGEGKTIVCHLSAFLKVIAGQKVHVVTVNDYLVKRDADFATPIFELLGITVGHIQAQMDPGGREGIRQRAYACDITYGTASEFGFDYLRDNMKTRLEDQVQGRLDYAIIDEVDSVLIDEARTPLIISGPARDDVTRYGRANRVAEEWVRRQARWDRQVHSTVAKFDGETHNIEKLEDAMHILGAGKRKIQRTDEGRNDDDNDDDTLAALGPDFLTDDQVEAVQFYEAEILKIPDNERYRRYFIVQQERKSTQLTHDGVTIAQDLLDMGSLYTGANMEWPHLIENALRSHKVYVRDKDYVVQKGEVIIVDPNTGRLMYGRQWSDGLHQAIEAKESVRVKEETQTLATVTIQNFFKLYGAMAGMTGTAATEAEEFMKIYKLEVVEIPTNRPVNRVDNNDTIYRSEEHKFRAIVDEIHEVHRRGRPADPFLLADVLAALRKVKEKVGESTERIDEAIQRFNKADDADEKKVTHFMLEVYDEEMGDLATGRPILVGTTSVENSERLSKLLTRTYGIEHEVLNAKNHAREADIVAKAGHRTLPARGEKIPLGNVTVATNMAGRGTDIKLEVGVVYPKCKVPQELPEGVASSALYPTGTTKCCIHCEEYDPATNCAQCFKPKIDPRFPELGRKVCTLNAPCGLHIVGTERHESRRIDNQLRGRSGRQGDPGSSRFFLSMEDDLLKLFMGPWMLKMLEKLGFTEGQSLEDKRLTKGIQKAQRKVEERNFSMRKHLLEWDEPMDYQRKEFYTQRQRILEGRDLPQMVLATIDATIRDAVDRFLARDYAVKCAVEWCRTQLDLNVSESAIDLDDLEDARHRIRDVAKDEAADQIRTSIGEYIDPEEPPSKWDVGGLVQWSARCYQANFTQNQLRKMDPPDIETAIYDAAVSHYDTLNLDGLQRFTDQMFKYNEFAEWARIKFNIELDRDELVDKPAEDVSAVLTQRIREAYRKREIAYPIEYRLEQAYSAEGPDSAAAADSIVRWTNQKYNVDWKTADVQGRDPKEIYEELLKLNEDFVTNGRLATEISEKTAGLEREAAVEWGKERFGVWWNQRRFDEGGDDVQAALEQQGREMLRWELSLLEQFVLLRIYDQMWKDHLLEMDHLKHAIMQRPLGGDQTHPQSQYAIEGRELFQQMWGRIDNRVTDIIFKVRAAPAGESMTAGTRGGPPLSFAQADATGAFAAAAADENAAMRAQGQQGKVETIRREKPRVKRNDPCPCGSGKKYKHCHGKQ